MGMIIFFLMHFSQIPTLSDLVARFLDHDNELFIQIADARTITTAFYDVNDVAIIVP
jgi:hypothetical protein